MQQTLFTIGHSLRSPWEFLQLLRAHQITAVCDIRSRPFSGRNPSFSRDTLMKWLCTYNMTYVHIPELGARATDPAVYREGKVQYSLLAQTARFNEGLKRILKGVERYRLALMCAEKDPITCHRAILVTRALRHTDLSIAHIIHPGQTQTNEQMELRLLRAVGLIQGDVFASADQLIEKAYELQAQRIAYSLPKTEKMLTKSGPWDSNGDKNDTDTD